MSDSSSPPWYRTPGFLASLPAISVLIGGAAHWFVYSWGMNCGIGGLCDAPLLDLKDLTPKNAAWIQGADVERVTWVAAAFLLVICAFMAASWFVRILRKSVVDPGAMQKMAGFGALALFVLAVTITPSYFFIDHVLEGIDGDWGRFFTFSISVSRGLAYGVATVGLVAVCGIAYLPKDPHPPENLALRIKLLNQALYVGSILLVISIVESDSLLRWALTYWGADPGTDIDLQGLLATTTAWGGLVHAVLLGIAFAAAAFVLKLAIENHSERPADEKDPESWIKENELKIPTPTRLLNILAILSPLLFGGTLEKLLVALK